MNNFTAFDPLKAKSLADTEVAAIAQKREIKNILGSYVGWFDPFSELIQNSLDSVEERLKLEEVNYEPTLWIKIDVQDNSLTVTDNGVGLDDQKFQKFLCPDISFKSGKTRGHKGVGATYLAYGFNHLQVSTKVPGYFAVGKMDGARNWLADENPSGNPQIVPDSSVVKDSIFQTIDRGVSIYIKFDKSTHPKDLKWLLSSTADQWYKILSTKTGLGAYFTEKRIRVLLTVVSKEGLITQIDKKGVEYYWPHMAVAKAASLSQITAKEKELFAKKGAGFILPSSLINLDAFYERWSTADLEKMASTDAVKLNEDELDILRTYKPEIYVAYVYSLKVWDAINDDLKVRSGQKILFGGIQIAANNMPQGETYQIPLNRNIGRQNQIHFVIHFDNCSADLGRKGFKSEIVEFSKKIAKEICDGPLMKVKYTLRPNTGTAPNLKREKEIGDWKKEMILYEQQNPIQINSDVFFLPTKRISLTSQPTREQDVIALFNQLLAGGVIRGIRILSTNERLTYDGLYRVVIEEPKAHHIYDAASNPLGIQKSTVDDFSLPFIMDPTVLEYKLSLDGLIEDIDSGEKNSNDIGLIVVWITGELYKENYKITSLLDPNNLSLREYHGVTHTITNISSGQKEMDLIVLSELIAYLNDKEQTIQNQIEKYEV